MSEKEEAKGDSNMKFTPSFSFLFHAIKSVVVYAREFWKVRTEMRARQDGPNVGDNAPNTTVFSMGEMQPKELLSFAKEGRPLVVNFGSFT